jgi:hypothetical protein
MSELYGDKTDHLPKTNVMKDDFGWSVPIETVPLPSKGLLYDPNTTLYNTETLQIKAMTAQEEDILLSQGLIKEGIVIETLIKSCLIDKTIDVSNLITGDKNALMIAIRVTGYGTDYNISHTCDNCKSYSEREINLGELGIKRLKINPIENGKNKFGFKLPITGKQIIFGFMDGKKQKNRDAKIAFNDKYTKNLNSKSITTFLEEVVEEIDSIRDKNKISHFIRNMPARDSSSLRKFIRENEPGIDMSHSYECKKCNHLNEINIPINSNFFWPDSK